MCASLRAVTKPRGEMKVRVRAKHRRSGMPRPYPEPRPHHRPPRGLQPRRGESERTRWDPKDGELCLSRLRSWETMMEGRSGSDVQIDRMT